MKRFKNILVGVDLSQGDRFVSSELPAPTAEAIERALWLAKRNSAHLRFFYALDEPPAAQRMIEESDGGEETIPGEAKGVLKSLVAQAVAEGVTADMEVRFGKSWLEMIREVQRNDHDLVVAGTRHLSGLKSLLVGSTGIKLLRKCPCPVWITQPQTNKDIQSILVAHDLCAVGDLAMDLGCAMAEIHGAQLHVVHSLDVPDMNSSLPARVSADTGAACRAQAEQHIDTQLAQFTFAKPAQVHIVKDRPDFAVIEQIERHDVELLVMGTIARTGIAGFLVGNTAERLLPRIPCSVLAVKPPGFVTPITL